MKLRAHEVTERRLAEQIKQNPQNIWELFPRDKELVEEIDQEIQGGELLESEAEELVRSNTAKAQSEWVRKTSHDLVDFIVAFETGRGLDELVEKMQTGDKKAALALTGTIDPEPETPAYEALKAIRRMYKDDAAFLSEVKQTSERARAKEKPKAKRHGRGGETLSTGRLIEIFFWIKFNEEWLLHELGDAETAYEALVDYLNNDAEHPGPESFRLMLQRLGLRDITR
jgi:hypothetical protein